MSSATPGDITQLLHRHLAGDGDAFDRLVAMVYERLRGIARRQLRGRRPGETLDTTALVHEVYLQLVDETGVPWQNRAHFFAITARAMRRIVVDHLRHRLAQKRGGGVAAVELTPDLLGERPEVERILAVDRALETLAGFNPRLVEVVECRFFAGMTREETAAALAISVRTVERDWTRARAWLRRELR
jgi:RNA polymerase sigma factor (TIGR02999 family)